MIKPNERRPRHWGTIALYAMLTVVVLLYSLPGLGVLLTSFKTTEEIARDGLWSLPDALRFTNYLEAWVGGNVLVYAAQLAAGDDPCHDRFDFVRHLDGLCL